MAEYERHTRSRRPTTRRVTSSGDERHMLIMSLDHFRSVLLRKPNDLSAENLGRSIGNSSLTLGGLQQHMALVEDHWFNFIWLGEADRAPANP
jgi:hypothetical protein